MQATANTMDMLEKATKDVTDENQAQEDLGRNLLSGTEGQTYIVREIRTDDDEMNAFLFRLGCYSGEPITIISKKKKSCIVAIKDSRYTLDKSLCEAIVI